MSILGIIAEYNPLHNGHVYHIKNAQKNSKANITIAAITGNYAQRGLPSKLDKYTKTQLCLKNNIDIVIEIPTKYSVSSAEYFAKQSVKLLEACGIECLAFGAECTNIEKLTSISYALKNEDNEYSQKLKSYLKLGFNFPRAREMALNIEEGIINRPNNILAIEYLKYLGEGIKPYLIERNKGLASATKIGSLIRDGNFDEIEKHVPKDTLIAIKENKEVWLNDFSSLFHYNFKNANNIFDLSMELYNRIKKSKSFLLEDLVGEISCKNYTKTRIQRVLIHTILNIRKEEITHEVPFVRILGFRKEASYYLRNIEKNVKIVTNIKNETSTEIKKEIFYSDVFYSARGEKNKIEYKFPVVM